MNNLIQELTPYLLGILGVLLAHFGRKLGITLSTFLNEKIDEKQWELIKDVIEGAVKFVEQVSKQDVKLYGEKKFNLAKEKALAILNDKGLTVTDEELELLIEKFVLEMKGID